MTVWTGPPRERLVECGVMDATGQVCVLVADHAGDWHESWSGWSWHDPTRSCRRPVNVYLPGDKPEGDE